MSGRERNDAGRRRFVKGVLGGAAAGVAASAFPDFFFRNARADTWGDAPEELVPGAPYKILEIHCYGAPSIWETLWVTKRPEGAPDYRGFDDEMAAADFLCPAADPAERPESSVLSPQLGVDELGNEVFLGPAARPIWPLIDRMRLIVQRHDSPMIPIHEAAVPYAITGTRVGDPRHAALGTAIARRRLATSAAQAAPHAYAIGTGTPTGISFLHQAAVAVGTHPGAARPLLIRMDSASELAGRLGRGGMREERDRLLDTLVGQYRDELLFHSMGGEPVRSAGFSGYRSALDSTFAADELQALLTGDLLTIPTAPYCVRESGDADPNAVPDRVGAALELARSLLTRPSNGAAHVLVADTGIETLGNQPCYDTHLSLVDSSFEMVRATTANLYNLFTGLARIVDPTGADPDKIDLRDTLIVVNTEFGRTEIPSGSAADKKGREHWPEGYVGLMMGGPIVAPGIAGGLDDRGRPTGADWFSPTDVRGAMMLAGGVWPFAEGTFGTSNSGPSIITGTEEGNAARLAEKILGVVS